VTDAEALDQVLRLEHATIWLLAVVGARLDDARRDLVRDAVDAHRTARDRLVAAVAAAGGDPTSSEIAYRLPATRNLAAAVRLQAATVRAYDALIAAASTADLRGLAAELLVSAAEHLALFRWAADAHLATATSAYPGR
jgi:hypothetical protein